MNEVTDLLEKRQKFHFGRAALSRAYIQKEYVAKTKRTRLPAS